MPTIIRLARTLAAATAVGAAVLLTTGMAPGGTDTAVEAPENPAAALAVSALTRVPAAAAASTVPAGFSAAEGYEPVVTDEMVTAPSGGCSSPVPLPAEFDEPCKAHDLGYDMLRYAASTGHPLGAWARRDIDTQLDRRMHESCSDRGTVSSRVHCAVMADVASAAVRLNSWRQDDSVPVPESPAPYLITAGSVLTLAVALRVRKAL